VEASKLDASSTASQPPRGRLRPSGSSPDARLTAQSRNAPSVPHLLLALGKGIGAETDDAVNQLVGVTERMQELGMEQEALELLDQWGSTAEKYLQSLRGTPR
jgi:hypothetical protein